MKMGSAEIFICLQIFRIFSISYNCWWDPNCLLGFSRDQTVKLASKLEKKIVLFRKGRMCRSKMCVMWASSWLVWSIARRTWRRRGRRLRGRRPSRRRPNRRRSAKRRRRQRRKTLTTLTVSWLVINYVVNIHFVHCCILSDFLTPATIAICLFVKDHQGDEFIL